MGNERRLPKFRLTWLWALLPVCLSVIIVALLVQLDILEFHFSIHHVDTLILLSGLLMSVILSAMLIFRQAIRELKRLSDQRAREELAEDRARFLRRLDHEIKNPLMGIKTALENLAETTDDGEQQHIRAAMHEQTERLIHLVSDLRKIADLERHDIEKMPVDLVALLKDAFSIISEDAQVNKRKLSADLPEHLPAIHGDYDLLLLAVYNVLNNSLKYTRQGDQITLRAGRSDLQLIVSVSDTGPGILPEDLPYVWDELFRSEAVKAINGSGIGLALVRRIIERHGGSVAICSQWQQGTVVQLMLPVMDDL